VENAELAPATTEGEKTCIANCQEKTYKAFDLFMKVNVRFAAKKDYRSYVDVSRYTEMEVEHAHDTASQIPRSNAEHLQPSWTRKFEKSVEENIGEVKNQALAHK
jgi:hypothetical protein